MADVDFRAAANGLLLPSSAGFTPSTTGELGYDSTQRRIRSYDGKITGMVGRALYVQRGSSDTITASVVGTTETAFATSAALPAGYLIASKALRVTMIGELTSSAGGPSIITTLRLQKAGPTNVNLYANTSAAPAGSKTNAGWGMEWIIQGTAAAGAAVSVECGPLGIAFWNGPNFVNTIAQPVTVDTASAQTIQITITWSANTAGNSLTLRQLIVTEIG